MCLSTGKLLTKVAFSIANDKSLKIILTNFNLKIFIKNTSLDFKLPVVMANNFE